MVGTSVHKVKDEYKEFTIDEIVSVYNKLDEYWRASRAMLMRLELIQSFSEYESEKLSAEETIQIHAISVVLKDITQLYESEVNKLEKLCMELFPYDSRGKCVMQGYDMQSMRL